MKTSHILIFIINFFAFNYNAQLKSDCQDVNIDSLYNSNLKIRIPVSSILGSWISNDTNPLKISFVENLNSVVIMPQHYINPFAFQIVNDSISSSGSAMNWPPYYCTFNLNADATLEIFYFDYMRENILCYSLKKE